MADASSMSGDSFPHSSGGGESETRPYGASLPATLDSGASASQRSNFDFHSGGSAAQNAGDEGASPHTRSGAGPAGQDGEAEQQEPSPSETGTGAGGAQGSGPSWKRRPTRRREGLRLRPLDDQEERVLPPDGKLYAYLLQRDKLAYNLWRKEVQRMSEETGGAGPGEGPQAPGATGAFAGAAVGGGRQRKRKEAASTVEPPRRLLRTLRPEDEFSWEELNSEAVLGDLPSAAETPGAPDSEAPGSKVEPDAVDGVGEADTEGQSVKEEKEGCSPAGGDGDITEARREGKEEDEDGREEEEAKKYHLEPYDASLEEEEERSLPLQMPNGVQKRKDDMTVPVEESPHWVIICRFLSFFGPTIAMEDWTFAAVREVVEAPELTDFGARFFSRISALFGRRYTPGNNVVRFLCKMLDERDGTDFNVLFPLDINPFTVRTWEEVRPYQRLRVMRLLVNRAVGESTAIQHFVEGLRDDKLEELHDGSFYVDSEGYIYWFIREPQSTGLRFYKEDQREGTYELLASSEQELTHYVETLQAQTNSDTVFVGLLQQQAQEFRLAAATLLLRQQEQRQQEQRQQALQIRMQAAAAAGLEASSGGLTNAGTPGLSSGAGAVDSSGSFQDAFAAGSGALGGEAAGCPIEYRIMMRNRLRGPRERGTRLQARTQRIEMQQLEAGNTPSAEAFGLEGSTASPGQGGNSLFLSPFSAALGPPASGALGSSSHLSSLSSLPTPPAFSSAPAYLPSAQGASSLSSSSLSYLPTSSPSFSSANPPYSLSFSLATAASAAASSGGGTPAAAAAAAAALAAGAAAAGGSGGAAPILPHCPLLISTSSLQSALSPFFALSSQTDETREKAARGKPSEKKGRRAFALPPLWGLKGGQSLGASQLMAGNAIYAALHLALMTYPAAFDSVSSSQAPRDEDEGAESEAGGSAQAAGPDDESLVEAKREEEKKEGEKPQGDRRRMEENRRHGEAIRFAVQDRLLKNIAGTVDLLEDLRVAASLGEAAESLKGPKGASGNSQVDEDCTREESRKEGDAEKSAAKDSDDACRREEGQKGEGDGKLVTEDEAAEREKRRGHQAEDEGTEDRGTKSEGDDSKKTDEKTKEATTADATKKGAVPASQGPTAKNAKKKGMHAAGPLRALGQASVTAADVLAFLNTICWAGRREEKPAGEKAEEAVKPEQEARKEEEAALAPAKKAEETDGVTPDASGTELAKKEETDKQPPKQTSQGLVEARDHLPVGLLSAATAAAALLEKNEIRLLTASASGKSQDGSASSGPALPSGPAAGAQSASLSSHQSPLVGQQPMRAGPQLGAKGPGVGQAVSAPGFFAGGSVPQGPCHSGPMQGPGGPQLSQGGWSPEGPQAESDRRREEDPAFHQQLLLRQQLLAQQRAQVNFPDFFKMQSVQMQLQNQRMYNQQQLQHVHHQLQQLLSRPPDCGSSFSRENSGGSGGSRAGGAQGEEGRQGSPEAQKHLEQMHQLRNLQVQQLQLQIQQLYLEQRKIQDQQQQLAMQMSSFSQAAGGGQMGSQFFYSPQGGPNVSVPPQTFGGQAQASGKAHFGGAGVGGQQYRPPQHLGVSPALGATPGAAPSPGMHADARGSLGSSGLQGPSNVMTQPGKANLVPSTGLTGGSEGTGAESAERALGAGRSPICGQESQGAQGACFSSFSCVPHPHAMLQQQRPQQYPMQQQFHQMPHHQGSAPLNQGGETNLGTVDSFGLPAGQGGSLVFNAFSANTGQ